MIALACFVPSINPEGFKLMTMPNSTYMSLNSPPSYDVLSGEDGALDAPHVTHTHTIEPRSAIERVQEQSVKEAVEGWFRDPLANSLAGLLERYPRAEIAQCMQVISERLKQSLGPTH